MRTTLCSVAIIAFVTWAAACKAPSNAGVPVTGSNASTGSGSGSQDEGDALGTSQAGKEKVKQGTVPATTAQTQTTQQTASTQTTPTQGQNNPNYTSPPAFELSNPRNIKLLNLLQEPITIVSGNRLTQPVPSGMTMVYAKRIADIDDYGAYVLSIGTASGGFASASFSPSDVNMDQWRASVKLLNGRIVIEQNAGGGGGGGGGGGYDDLNNFDVGEY